MMELLQEQIDKLNPIKHKAVHLQTVKASMEADYNQLLNIVRQQKCMHILQEIDGQDIQDQLLFQKLQINKIHRQKQQQLQSLVLQKNRMLKQCEINELKLQKSKQMQLRLKQENNRMSQEKAKIQREIKENQVICERVCLQNVKLREDCQQQIQRVSNYKVEGDQLKIHPRIRKIVYQNAAIVAKIINLTQQNQQKNQILAAKKNDQDRLKLIQLTQQLQLQKSQNIYVKSEIKCAENRYFELSSKLQFLQKDSSLRLSLLQSANEQQYELCKQVEMETNKRQQLQVKLQQYKRIKGQLQEMYEGLSSNYKLYRSDDLTCIKQMNRNSYKLERNITKQRHFLLQRYSIVDSYRKYLNKHA